MVKLTGNQKVRESRLRRVAERQGLLLRRSMRRDTLAKDYGRYWLWDRENGDETHVLPVFGGDYGATLDEIENHLLDRKAAA